LNQQREKAVNLFEFERRKTQTVAEFYSQHLILKMWFIFIDGVTVGLAQVFSVNLTEEKKTCVV